VTRTFIWLLAALILVSFAACSRVETKTEASAGADFSRLKTYAWIPRKTQGGKNFSERFLFTDKQVREAVDRRLAAQGFRRVEPEAGPDFWVQYYLWADEGVTGGSPYPYNYAGWGYRRGGTLDAATGRYGDYRMSARDVRQGTLIITVNDGRTKREIWRGSAQAMVKDKHDKAQVARLIDEAVRRILEDFPPK
jgi:hypothetical protein